MRFTETALDGPLIIDLEPIADDRGFFARAFCQREFAERGLETEVRQCNFSYNRHAGTVRGFHFQAEPAAEAKLVRCVRGAVLNVVVDVRPDSDTYLRHVAIELSARNRRALYVPKLFASGMQTLVDDTELYYQLSEFYTPQAERGLRHDDPAIGVKWPLPVREISAKDGAWPLLARAAIEP